MEFVIWNFLLSIAFVGCLVFEAASELPVAGSVKKGDVLIAVDGNSVEGIAMPQVRFDCVTFQCLYF